MVYNPGPALVKASRVMTATVPFDNGDEVQIGDVLYVFKQWTLYPGEVKRTGVLSSELANLAACINGTGVGDGTDYVPSDAHNLEGANPYCTATSDATTLTVTARVAGVSGNVIPVRESSASASWPGAQNVTQSTLAGGAGYDVRALENIHEHGQVNAGVLTLLRRMLGLT